MTTRLIKTAPVLDKLGNISSPRWTGNSQPIRLSQNRCNGSVMTDNDIAVGSPAYLFELAQILEVNDETTLGPTDAHHAAVALRLYAAYLDASIPSQR